MLKLEVTLIIFTVHTSARYLVNTLYDSKRFMYTLFIVIIMQWQTAALIKAHADAMQSDASFWIIHRYIYCF